MKRRNHNRTNISTLRIRAAFVGIESEGIAKKALARTLAKWAQENNENDNRNRSFTAAIHSLGKFPEWELHTKGLKTLHMAKVKKAQEDSRQRAIEIRAQTRLNQGERREAREEAAANNTTVQAERNAAKKARKAAKGESPLAKAA